MTKETFKKAQKLLDQREYLYEVQFTLLNSRSEDSLLCAVKFDKDTGKPKFLNKVYLTEELKNSFISIIQKQISSCEEEFNKL